MMLQMNLINADSIIILYDKSKSMYKQLTQ